MKQIFISYRREGGESLAHLLYERLTRDGYDVFLDVESLRSGDFNAALLDKIEECADFLLILPPNALDRCKNPQDWVRQEIEHALKNDKNIIPVLLRNFVFPEFLPDSLSGLEKYNGLTANMEYFDAVIERLEKKLLVSKPKIKKNPPVNTTKKNAIVCPKCKSHRLEEIATFEELFMNDPSDKMTFIYRYIGAIIASGSCMIYFLLTRIGLLDFRWLTLILMFTIVWFMGTGATAFYAEYSKHNVMVRGTLDWQFVCCNCKHKFTYQASYKARKEDYVIELIRADNTKIRKEE